MTTEPATAGAPNLIERAKNILLSPRAEWARIATESTEIGPLLVSYVLPLAAIGALASVIGSMLFLGFLFGAAGLIPAVVGAALGVGFTLLGVFLCGLLVNALASSFGSQPNQMRANQLAAYSSTAGLIGSWGAIIPFLGWAFALAGGIYSVVLFYMGLTPMMQTPEDKRVIFTIVLALIAIVAYWIIGMVVAMMLLSLGLGAAGALSRGLSDNQNAPQQSEASLFGGGSLDLDALQKQAEAMQGGSAAVVDATRVQEQLPQTLPGGFALMSSSSNTAVGMAQAEGVYRSGDAELRVTVVQIGAMGAVASMAAGVNMQENRRDADGYARTQTIDGRIYNEEVSNGGRSASYGVIGHGVAVSVEGTNGVTLDQARAAVETIGVQRLERQFGA